MPERTLQEPLAAAQSRVREARALLACPRTCDLEACATLLRGAQDDLEQLRDSLLAGGPGGGELRQQATLLGREIRQAGALLEQAAHFGRNWLERLRAASRGYTAAGSPAPIPPCGQISLMG